MSRLNLLKTKEQELINENVIFNSLISQVLTKINSSIKILEAEDNKSEFRSLYLSTLCLTDKINEKLIEINLELEEFILDKQIDTSELDFCTKTTNINLSEKNVTSSKVINTDQERLSDDNGASKVVKTDKKSYSPYKTGNASGENATQNVKRKKLKFERNVVDESTEDVRICKQPASLIPPSFLNRNVQKKCDKNSNIKNKQSPSSFNTPPLNIPGNPDTELNSREKMNYEGRIKPELEIKLFDKYDCNKTCGNDNIKPKSKEYKNGNFKEINRHNDVENYRDERSKTVSMYRDHENICMSLNFKNEDYEIPRRVITQFEENFDRNNYEDRRVGESYNITQEKVTRKDLENKKFRKISRSNTTQENVQSDSYEDETARDISIRKCEEYLAAPKIPNSKHSRRGHISEQKHAIDIGPPSFKKISLASLSINEAYKSTKLFNTTDSCYSYESERNFEEVNIDKNLNTEKQRGFMNSLNNFMVCNQGDTSEDKIPVKDCGVEVCNEMDQSIKNNNDTEVYKGSSGLPPQGALTLSSEIRLPESENNLPKVNVTNDDRCIVTHAKSPECFYIITSTATENITDYDRFHEELQTYCDTITRNFSSKNDIRASKAHYYCCFNELDDYSYNWFRCKIIDWLSDDETNENKVRVLAVDDGFEKDVMIDKLRDYPQTKYSLPEMAIKCRLRNLYPPKSTKNHILEQWPQVTIKFFNEVIGNSRINPFYVTDVHQTSDCYEVDLCNNQRVSLSTVMVQMDLAIIIEPGKVVIKSADSVVKCDNLLDEPNKLVRESEKKLVEPRKLEANSAELLIKSELMKDQIKQAQGFNVNNDENPLDNLDDCKTNLDEAICDHMEGGYCPKDYTRLCRFTEKDGEKCFKGDNCQFEHKLPDPDGWTSDKVGAFTVTTQIEEPKIGDKLTIMVTFIKTVCRFYAHIKPSKQKRQMSSASKIIYTANQFSKYINKPENFNHLKKFKILPANGQLVIVRSPNDNKWYRARVLNIVSEDEFEVIFIDYGDVCTVKFNNIREIKPEHLGLPEQAVEFRISSIDPINTKDPEYMFNAAIHLAELTLDHVLTALVINNGYPIEVEIYTDEGVNIGNYFKMLNLAKDRDLTYIPKIEQMSLE